MDFHEAETALNHRHTFNSRLFIFTFSVGSVGGVDTIGPKLFTDRAVHLEFALLVALGAQLEVP